MALSIKQRRNIAFVIIILGVIFWLIGAHAYINSPLKRPPIPTQGFHYLGALSLLCFFGGVGSWIALIGMKDHTEENADGE